LTTFSPDPIPVNPIDALRKMQGHAPKNFIMSQLAYLCHRTFSFKQYPSLDINALTKVAQIKSFSPRVPAFSQSIYWVDRNWIG